MKLLQQAAFYCPLCEEYLPRSSKVQSVDFPSAVEWLTHMVMHYRHDHMRYYERNVRKLDSHRRYQNFKHMVNEKARRQIIRKCWRFLLEHDIRASHFEQLQGTGKKTLALARKRLSTKDRKEATAANSV